MSSNEINLVDQMPYEMWEHVLQFADKKSILNFRLSTKECNQLATNAFLCKYTGLSLKTIHYSGLPENEKIQSYINNYYSFFKNHLKLPDNIADNDVDLEIVNNLDKLKTDCIKAIEKETSPEIVDMYRKAIGDKAGILHTCLSSGIGNKEIIRLFLDAIPDLSMPALDSALACRSTKLEVIQLLMEEGNCSVNTANILSAKVMNDSNILKYLLPKAPKESSNFFTDFEKWKQEKGYE